MPRVSVLLTCFNHLTYLPPCLGSVFAQTFKDYEVVALDDGSSDGTREWLQQQTDPRVRLVFNERNLGTYASLNRGIERSEGEFIAILNDDDKWQPQKLERQIELLESHPQVALTHTGGSFIDASGQVIGLPAPLGFPFPKTPTGDVLSLLVESNKICTSAAAFRREALKQVGVFDSGFYGMGDWHLWLRIAREFEVGYVDEKLTDYRVHGRNASLASEAMLKDDLRLREWISTWIGEKPELAGAMAQNWAALGHLQMMLGDASGARVALEEALRLQPKRLKTRVRYLMSYLPKAIRGMIG